MEINESKPPITEKQLAATERKLKISLPPQYRAFLLRHNGGWPEPDSFVFKQGRGSYSDSTVNRFLAIHDGPHSNFVEYFKTYKTEHPRVPEELVPIANDPGGNLICIALAGDRPGAVYFWDHEEEADFRDGEPATWDNVHLVADSFDAFLQGLGQTPKRRRE